MSNDIVIYENDLQQIEVRLDSLQETLWLSQAQIAELFQVTPQNITMHLKNIFNDGELNEMATCKDFLQVQNEGSRLVNRQRKHYNLDAVISVGYRVSSVRATQFRIWATQRLKEHLVQGYTINQQRFEQNAQELQQAIALIQKTAKSSDLTAQAGSGLVDIVSRYTQTFLWLQRYDEGLLNEPEGQARSS